MKTISKPQITKIHVLLNQNGWIGDKAEIVTAITDGRTTSTRELTFEEAGQMIQYLSEHNPYERMKSLIFSLAYQAGIIYGTTNADKKMNAAKLDMFLQSRGSVKKKLNVMNIAELTKTHRQFQAIARASAKSRDNKEAANAVGKLLSELDMVTA